VQAVSACEVVAIGKTAFSAVLSANPTSPNDQPALAEQRASSTSIEAAAREPTRVGRLNTKAAFCGVCVKLLAL